VPWIHLEDEVGIIMHALEKAGCTGPLNLVAPNPVTNAELTAAIAGLLRKPAILHAPAFGIRLALGELSEVALGSQRAEPRAALAGGYEFRHPDLRGALAALA
jgi:NAD dependent epimerase/dehydratase family enzyme